MMTTTTTTTTTGFSGSALESRQLFIAVILLGVACRILLAWQTPFWLDELWSSAFSHPQLTLGEVITKTISDVHPPLYQMGLYGWYLLFGFSELSGRLLSLLIGLAAIPLFYLLAEAVYDSRTARIGTLLFAISPLAVGFSSEVRSYELLLLLAILSSYFLVRIFRKKGAAGYIGYFFSALAIAYTHYFGIILLFCHFVSVAIIAAKSRNWKAAGPVSGIYFLLLLCYLPMLQAVSTNLARSGFWIKNPGIVELAMYIPWYFSGPFAFPLFMLLGWMGYKVRQNLGLTEALLALSILIVLLLPWALGFFISPVITLRNTIVFLPFIVLLISHICATSAARYTLAVVAYSAVILLVAVGYSLVNKGEHIDRLLAAVKEDPAPLYFPETESWTVEYFSIKIELNGDRYTEIHPLIVANRQSPMPDEYWLACYHKCYLFNLEEWIPASHVIKRQVKGRGVNAFLLKKNEPLQEN